MACGTLTKGRGLDCNRISGGIKNIYFAVYDQVLSTTVNVDEITDIDMGTSSLYKYTMPLGVASLTDTITGSRENGTVFFTPTVNIILNRLTKEDQNEIKLLGATRVRIFAQLNEQLANGHDVILALGMANGLSLNSGSMDSGAAFGDRNGYTLTFTGLEPLPMAFLEDYTTDPFDNTGFTGEGGTFPVIS